MPQDRPEELDIPALRTQIDAIDQQVLDLLIRRARVAIQVGEYKRNHNMPAYVPGREREILERMTPEMVHPVPLRGAVAVFREVISACRSLEEVPIVAFLGPSATFTEVAARNVWGECVIYKPFDSLDALFEGLRSGDAVFAVVPIENSTAGTIREVLDQLATGGDYMIVGESYVDIHHCLLANTAPDQLREIQSKDAALEQCRMWLKANAPQARLVPVSSTTTGVEAAAADPMVGAIGTELAGTRYGVTIQARNIEDLRDNRTRFFTLGPTWSRPTGSDKTSLVMHLDHRPGALVQALEVLRRHQLNMTLIESRPLRMAPFEYAFFVDIEGHADDEHTAAGIHDLRVVCRRVVVLGSYPKAT
ncbi:MAG: prephenate dehydratase [Armatimonadetes bacterium]|nr:prephenate dehydratase [Armatimonadota bacterium]